MKKSANIVFVKSFHIHLFTLNMCTYLLFLTYGFSDTKNMIYFIAVSKIWTFSLHIVVFGHIGLLSLTYNEGCNVQLLVISDV